MFKSIFKALILILFIFLYKYNFEICEKYFPQQADLTSWWILRLKFYAFMFCLPLYSNTINVDTDKEIKFRKFKFSVYKLNRLFEYIIFGIMWTDAGMFILFNETKSSIWDLIGVSAITYVGYLNIYKLDKTK